MSTSISILIRTKNEVKDLPTALELIRAQSLQPIEIIVVDSGSTDGTVELLQQQRDVQLIQMHPDEFSFGRSLNLGMRAVSGEIVVSLSAHAFPADRDWLHHLVKHFENPQVAGVYGKQLPQPDAYPPVQREYLNYYSDRLQLQTNAADPRDHVFSNANSAIRVSCWQQRHFDELLTGGEDWEWGRAMLERGYSLVYDPLAAVYHSHNESLLKVYQRTYREALAYQKIYGNRTGLRYSIQRWYKATAADMQYILQAHQNPFWLLRVPLYRLFWAYGYLSPDMPHALWQPILKRVTRSHSLSNVKDVPAE